MSKEELKELRRELGMTMKEFGEWMAQRVNEQQGQGQKPVSPYTRQRVNAWEVGEVQIPAKAELVIIRRKLEQTQAEVQKLKQRRKQKQR